MREAAAGSEATKVGNEVTVNTPKNGQATIVEEKGDKVKLSDGRWVKKSSVSETTEKEKAAGLDELTSDTKPSTETELETEANIAAKRITERLKAEAKKRKAETKAEPTAVTPDTVVEPEVVAEPEIVAEPTAEPKGQLDLFETVLNLDEETKEDFGEEGNAIINNRLKRKKKRRGKGKKSRKGLTSALSSNPVQFARVLQHMRKIFPQIDIDTLERIFDENGLEVLGLAKTGGVQINENSATQDTLFHELGHHFVKMLSGDRLYNEGIDMIKDTPYMDMAKELYPNESVEDQAEEALMMLVGEKSVDMINTKLDGSRLQKALTWLKKFWNRLKHRLGKASAAEVAEIMAADLAFRNSPVLSSGLVIDGNKYSKTFAQKDRASHNAIRNASIMARIEYDKLPKKLQKNKKFVSQLVNEMFLDEYANLRANKQIPSDVDSYVGWKTKYKGALNEFIHSISTDFLFEELQDLDEAAAGATNTEEIRKAQGIDSDTKIDKNIKAVLDTLRDIRGEKIPIDKIYGISARIAELTEHPSEFLDNLNTRFIKGKYVNSLDAYIARELYDTLSALPPEIQLPVVTQLTSVHNVPMDSIAMSIKGIFNNVSNQSWTKNDINDILQNHVLAEFDRQNFKKNIKKREGFIGAAKEARRDAATALKNWDKAGRPDAYTELDTATKKLLRSLQQLSGIPNLDSTWFTAIEEKYVESRSKAKKELGSDATTLRNMIKLSNAIIEADKLYKSDKGKAKTERRLYKARLKEALTVVADNLDSSYSTRGTYKNVVGNQMMSFRVGGFMHKFFNKPSFRRGDRMKFDHISRKLNDRYKKVFNEINNSGQPVVSHSDGFKNQITGQSIEAKNMNEAETNWFNLMMFGTSLKDGIVKTNMGILGDRGFFTLAKVPLLSKKQYLAEHNELVKYIKENNLTDFYSVSDTEIAKDVAIHKENYKKLTTKEATWAFGNHSSKQLGDFVGDYARDKTNQLESQYETLTPEINRNIEKIVDKDIENKRAEGFFVNQFKTHLDGEIDGIIEQFVYNDMIHRFNLMSMSLGDLSAFKDKNGKPNSKEAVKRLKGGTTPYTTIDLGKNKDGSPKQIISISIEDVLTQTVEEFNAKRVAKGLEPLSAEEALRKIPSATDSQEYMNDYYVGKIQESGGVVVDYGNTFKTVVNGRNTDGSYHYHKSSTIGFKGVDMDKGYYQMSPEYKGKGDRVIEESHHMRINKVLQKLSLQYPDTPIKIIYPSGIKSKSQGKVYSIDALEKATEEGFNLDNALAIDQEISGVQFNISKDVTKDDVNTTLSTQLANLIPSLAVAMGVPELAQEFDNAYSALILKDLREITKDVSNKSEIIKRVLDAAGAGLSSVDRRMIETALEEGANTFDHVGIARKLQNFMSAQFGKALSKRVNGAEMLQTVDATGQLKYHTSGANGEIIHAEVLVPEGFAELGEELITVRIPLSAPASIMIVKVAGFTPKGGNSIVAPKGWIDASNADNDGDKLFTWKKGTRARGDNSSFNKLFDTTMKVLKNRKLIGEGTGFDYELDIKNVKEDMLKAKVNTGQYATVEEARTAIDGSLDISTGTKMVSAKKKLDESQKLIGIFAVGSKVMHEMNRLGAELIGGYSIFGATRIEEGQNKEIGIENINGMAEILQYELDNAAEFSADEMGITVNNAPLAVIALASGNSTEDIFTFLNSEPIREIEKRIKESNNVHESGSRKFKSEIINDVRKEFTGTYKVGNTSMTAETLINKYEQGLKIATRPEYKLLQSLTQLDKRPPNDLITLYKLLGDIERYRRDTGVAQEELAAEYDGGFGKINKAEYDKRLKTLGKKKASRKGSFKISDMLGNPVLAARIEVIKQQRISLEQYFQFKTNKLGDEIAMREVINSFAFDRVNVNRQRLSDLINRVHTERVSQKLAKNPINSSKDFDRELGELTDIIKEAKSGRTQIKQWLSLIDIDNSTGLIVPMHGVSIPELGLKATEESDVVVDEEFVRRTWNLLPKRLQDKLIDYSIYADGFSGGATSIMHLLPKEVYKNYQQEVKKNALTDEGITDEFIRDVAVKGIDDITIYDKNHFRGDAFADEISTSSGDFVSKFFVLVNDKGVKHLYERGEMRYNNKKFAFSANKVISSDSETYVKIGNQNVVIYGDGKSYLVPQELDADIDPNDSENQQTSAADSIISDSNTEEDSNLDWMDNGEMPFQKMPSETSNEGSKRLNRRILRRLSAKFGVAYKVINDPELKARGYYDSNANVVVINEAYATSDTAFHEFAHPFVSAIKKSNPTLYANLIAEVNNSEEGRKVLEEVSKKYPELNKVAQTEEAMVQMLGMLAADKISSPSLKTVLQELWDAIVTTLKSIFQKNSDKIPSDLSPSASLGDIASMLVDKSTIDLDRKNDIKARQILRKLKNILNNTVSVTKASEIMSAEQKAVFDKVSKAGFLINNRYVVRQKNDINTDVPLEFRVPLDKDNWMRDLRKEYPEAKIIQKEKSGFEGFKKFRVSLDGENVATVYKPTNEQAGSLNNTVTAGVYWSRVNPTIATGKEGDYNMDKKLFNGLNYHKDSFLAEPLKKGGFDKKFIEYTEVAFKQAMNMNDAEYSDVQDAYNQSTETKKKAVSKAAIVEAISKSISVFQSLADDNKLQGDLTKVVDVNFIKKIAREQSEEMYAILNGKGEVKSNADVNEAVDALKRMVTMSSFMNENKDSIHSDGKGISSQAIANDIVRRATETAEKRVNAILKVPVIGYLFNKIMNASPSVKKWSYKMLTPEVFSNVATGNESNFLHALLYDAMNDGERKDRDFKFAAEETLLDGLPPDVKTSMSEWSINFSANVSTEEGRTEARNKILSKEKNTMTVVVKEGSPVKMTKGEALSLYMSLSRDRMNRYFSKGKSVKILVDGKEYSISDGNWAKLKKEVELDKELMHVRDNMRKMFAVTHPMVNETMKNTMGVELNKDTNYYPLQFGKIDDTSSSNQTRRIEDLTSIKEATYNPDASGQLPLRVDDSFNVVKRYVSNSATFYAYAEPVYNLRKLYRKMDSSKGYETKTHQMIKEYILSITDAVQDNTLLGGITDNQWDRSIQKYMNRFTVAVLGYNPSVQIKQVVSVISASTELGKGILGDPKYRGVALKVINDSYSNKGQVKRTQISKGTIGVLDLTNPVIAEMMAKNSLAKQRFTGYIDREQGEMKADSLNSLGKGNKTKVLGKELDLQKSMEGIKIMDAAAMAFIWEAVKDQMASKHSVGSDAYWAAVNEKFEQTVNRTQPTYGVVNRTELGRSKNQLLRLFTMFSSQRAKNMNMMVDSMNSYLVDPNERTRLQMQWTLTAVGIWSSLAIAAIDKLKYTLYGNDDDEGILENAGGLAKGTVMTTLGNFYGIAQASQMFMAHRENKPFGKSIEHPVFQSASLVLNGMSHLSKGELLKAGDKGLQGMMRLGGIPLFPYTTGRRIVKGTFGDDSSVSGSGSGAKSGDKSPTYHGLNESNLESVDKMMRKYDKIQLMQKADKLGITYGEKVRSKELAANLYLAGFRIPVKKKKRKTNK